MSSYASALVSAAPATAEWRDRLAALTRLLRELERQSEGEFLAIGEQLQCFHERCTSIAARSDEIAGEITGRAIAGARDGLTRLVDDLERHFEQASGVSGGFRETLAAILETLRAADRSLANFEKLIRMLRMLGISTKIESARLTTEDTGFDTLSAAVAKLSVRIDERLSALCEQKARLAARVQRTQERLAAIEGERRSNSREIFAKIRHGLAALAQTHEHGSAAAARAARASGDIAGNIAQVVVGLQFHDITRQELEHAREALEELAAELEEPGGVPALFAGICELQAAQVVRSRDSLCAAVDEVVRNIAGLAPNVSRIADETRDVTGMLDRGGHSFLDDLRSALEPVIGRLAVDAEGMRELERVLAGVAEATGQMSGFVQEIERVGSEIEKIALNANVKAAHIGREGATLGVLAEAIQRLSVDTRHETEAVSAPLREVLAVAGTLGGRAHDALAAGDGASAGGGGERLRTLLLALRGMNGRVLELLSGLDAETPALARDIAAAVGRIGVHRAARETLGHVAAELGALAGLARAVAPPETEADRDGLARLQARYTTRGERKVHAAVSDGSDAAGAAEAGLGADDLGDNVELF